MTLHVALTDASFPDLAPQPPAATSMSPPAPPLSAAAAALDGDGGGSAEVLIEEIHPEARDGADAVRASTAANPMLRNAAIALGGDSGGGSTEVLIEDVHPDMDDDNDAPVRRASTGANPMLRAAGGGGDASGGAGGSEVLALPETFPDAAGSEKHMADGAPSASNPMPSARAIAARPVDQKMADAFVIRHGFVAAFFVCDGSTSPLEFCAQTLGDTVATALRSGAVLAT